MKKGIAIIIGVVVTCAVVAFMINDFGGSKIAQGEELEENIRKSMEETEERNEKLKVFRKDLHESFREEGFEGNFSNSIDNIFSNESPSVTVRVKDEQYKQKHEEEMKSLINNLIESYNFDNVAIHVKVRHWDMEELSEEDKKRRDLTHEIFEISSHVLEKEGYDQVDGMGIQSLESKPILTIEIKGTKQHYKKVKDDIEKLVHDAIQAKKDLDYTVKVNRQTEAEVRDMEWSPIFRSIMEETDKRFDHVKGFAYSFHPEPLQIIIKTSLSQEWFSWGEKKRVEDIGEYVEQIIEIKREDLSIEKIPYTIIVRGKESKQLGTFAKD
ncbi:hypothetical protein MUO14_16640 [Halobacillus shinanisalinarum]|uniref:Uncharacterized protein n=1 Tax=Halobacillus shinanisalinarum TaxID=2932258 RepID=A0ABY4GVB8_9BACI|nr:hypothetical protein [Halobacillus shinanisalinarum]UOQ92111.1 hypothetical protein MUO14_16640 [Halobacillus shinanisalinarum]